MLDFSSQLFGTSFLDKVSNWPLWRVNIHGMFECVYIPHVEDRASKLIVPKWLSAADGSHSRAPWIEAGRLCSVSPRMQFEYPRSHSSDGWIAQHPFGPWATFVPRLDAASIFFLPPEKKLPELRASVSSRGPSFQLTFRFKPIFDKDLGRV